MESTPSMSVTDVKAAARALSRADQLLLLWALKESLNTDIARDYPAHSRWILDEVKARRMNTAPAECVAEMLDREAEGAPADADPQEIAETERPSSEFSNHQEQQ